MRKLFGHLQSRSQEMSIKRLDPMIRKKKTSKEIIKRDFILNNTFDFFTYQML